MMMSQRDIEDLEGTILPIQGVTEDESSVIVRLANSSLALVPIRYLQRKTEDRYYLPMSFHDLKEPGKDSTRLIPVIEEKPIVSKRTVETEKVTIRKTVKETPKIIEESLAREEVRVDRVPKHEIRDEPAQPRFEGSVQVIPVQEEILVVEKKYLVKEEIRIEKIHVQQNEKVTVSLKSEEVTVERKKLN